MLSDDVLSYLIGLSMRVDSPPWVSSVEGRDHFAGDSVILVGEGLTRREDLYVTRDSGPADAATLDLIAAARTYLPELIDEVIRLRKEVVRLEGELL